MKRWMLSLFLGMFGLLSTLAYAEDAHYDALRAYRLADGRGVAVAFPGEWIEVSRTRVLDAGAPAQFVDPAGRRIEIPADVLSRAAESKSVARPPEPRRVAMRSR